MHLLIGQIGHLLVIISFVTAILTAIGYYQAHLHEKDTSWKNFARVAFGIHGLAVFGIVAVLFAMIYNHYFEYHYVWSHSSRNLPYYYMISCFWEGQEGSFLLWIFWHVCVGLYVISRKGKWEAPVMMIFAAVQAFLTSMIIGIGIPYLEVKIGSSPFMLLREVMIDAPIFQSQPNYIPDDGTGLNPLLQNYWMVIHPPTLFLGFALCLVPFAYAIAGLVRKEPSAWLKPAFSWALFAAAVLGIGIVMGAYWAYETLNFGGYWNWDPVENAVYIPWLTLVAGIHAMTMQQKRPSAAKSATFLILATFILVLYSTFLTRSGVLGESSVHSFTDLGLSGQLLQYLLFFSLVAVILLVINWKYFPKSKKEASLYSGEFWLTLGTVMLCLSALQVLVPTSIPVYNALLDFIGIDSNVAPPADPEIFYTQWQLWFSVGIALLSATAQLFWWKKVDKKNLKEIFVVPIVLTSLLTTFAIAFAEIEKLSYMLLVLTSLYSLVSNGLSLFRLLKFNPKLLGGALAHIGVAFMFLGILSSSGYDEIISLNNSGLLYNREFSDDVNRENVLLFRNQANQMGKYRITYEGQYIDSPDFPVYLSKEVIKNTAYSHKVVALHNLTYKGEEVVQKGDTLRVFNENTYYRIDYVDTTSNETFTLYPRVQQNPQMGFVVSPDIAQGIGSDLYTHLSSLPDPMEERTWREEEAVSLSPKDTFILNDFVAILDDVRSAQPLGDEDYMVYASIRILDKDETYTARPMFQIKGDQVRGIPEKVEPAGVELTLTNIDPKNEKFTFKVRTTQRDWVIMKAVRKPYISLLWLGTIVMTLGMIVAMWRRYTERK